MIAQPTIKFSYIISSIKALYAHLMLLLGGGGIFCSIAPPCMLNIRFLV